MDKKRIATLFLIVLMDTAGATAIVPLIPIVVLAQFRATPFQAVLLVATFYVAQMLGVFQSVSSLTFILSIVWAGAVFDYVSPQAVYGVSAGLLAPSEEILLLCDSVRLHSEPESLMRELENIG